MREQDQRTKAMTKVVEGMETKFYVPPIFDVYTIKEMKMEVQTKT